MTISRHVGGFGFHTIMREFVQGSKNTAARFLISSSIAYMCSSRGVRYEINPNFLGTGKDMQRCFS